MAKRVIEDATLQSIAEAIREKAKTTEGMTPLQMPGAILDIKGAEINEQTNSSGGKTVYINSEPEKLPELPEGFTRLKWIQSDGRQYVNTGVYLGGMSRVVFEFQHVALDDYNCLFGSRDGAANVNAFAFWTAAQQYLEGYYGSERFAFPDNFPLTNQYTIDWNGNSISMAGTVLSVSQANFTAGFPAYLFAINQGGTASYHAKAKGFACKMYDDNDTLIRNYIPCLNASGEAGLWDTATQAFFGDAAGVGFIAGPELVLEDQCVSKVVLEDEVLIDLTGDTISPETVLAGFIGHDKTGAQFVGELVQKAGNPIAYGYLTTNNATSFTISGLPFRPVGIVFACSLNEGESFVTTVAGGHYVVGDPHLAYIYADMYGASFQKTGVTITDTSIAVPFGYSLKQKIFYVVWGDA